MLLNIFLYIWDMFSNLGVFEAFDYLFRDQTLSQSNPAEFIFAIFIIFCTSFFLWLILKLFIGLIRKFLEVINFD